MDPTPRYLIIGDGCLATHMNHYLDLASIPNFIWSRKKDPDEHNLLSSIHCASHVWVLIKDEAVVPFLTKHKSALHKKIVMHASAKVTTPLAISCHPFMVFGLHLYEDEFYPTIPFLLDIDTYTWDELFPLLPNPNYILPPEEKPLYQALRVLTGNVSGFLWEKLFRTCESKWSIPREIIFPYLDKVMEHVVSQSAHQLSGPWVSKDWKDIYALRDALAEDAFLPLYDAFLSLFLPETYRSAYLHRCHDQTHTTIHATV